MCALKLKGAERAKHVLPPPRLSSSKHRPIVENGTFSNGAVSAEPKGTPSGAPLRGSTDTRYLSEGGPGAGAPHGILAGPRQPLVPFPCGKGTRASADARNSLKQRLDPRLCAAFPKGGAGTFAYGDRPPSVCRLPPHHPLPAGTKKTLHVLTRTELSLISIPTISIPTSQTPRSRCGRESSSRSQRIDPADTLRRDPSTLQS